MEFTTHANADKIMNTIAFIIDEHLCDKEFSRKEYEKARKEAQNIYGKIFGFEALKDSTLKCVRKEPIEITLQCPTYEDYIVLDNGEKVMPLKDWVWGGTSSIAKAFIRDKLNNGNPLHEERVVTDTIQSEKFYYTASLDRLKKNMTKGFSVRTLNGEIEELKNHIAFLESLIDKVNTFTDKYE